MGGGGNRMMVESCGFVDDVCKWLLDEREEKGRAR